jgi:hypothetical protein
MPSQASTVKMRRDERAREEKRRKWKCGLLFWWRRGEEKSECVWGEERKNLNVEGVCRESHMRDKVFLSVKFRKCPST